MDVQRLSPRGALATWRRLVAAAVPSFSGIVCMIELYCVPTANGQKATILLEESGLRYRAIHVVRAVGAPPPLSYLDISPMGKYPALVDKNPGFPHAVTVFGTLAIALYVCERSQKMLPADLESRASAWSWASVVATDLSPMMGVQYFTTLRARSDLSEATQYVEAEARRALRAMEQRLSESDFLAGSEFSFADALAYPLAVTSIRRLAEELAPYDALVRWRDRVGARPGVIAGMAAAQG